MKGSRQSRSAPVLITEAPISADQEFATRRRRYLVMMLGRALCVLGAVFTYHFSPWLAAAFLIAALVLPWSAVLLANNRPPRSAVRFRRFLPGSPDGPAALPGSAASPEDRDVIDL